VLGRYLAAYLETRAPLAREGEAAA
jgi:hypothetical protein